MAIRPHEMRPQETECGAYVGLLTSNHSRARGFTCRSPLLRARSVAQSPDPAGDLSTTMGAAEWGLLVVLSVLWGWSFFFVEVALEALPP